MWCPVLGTSWRGRHGVRPCLENDRREAKKGTGSRRRNRRMVEHRGGSAGDECKEVKLK